MGRVARGLCDRPGFMASSITALMLVMASCAFVTVLFVAQDSGTGLSFNPRETVVLVAKDSGVVRSSSPSETAHEHAVANTTQTADTEPRLDDHSNCKVEVAAQIEDNRRTQDVCTGQWYYCNDTKNEKSAWVVTIQSLHSNFFRAHGNVSYLEYAYVMLRSLIEVGTSKDIVLIYADVSEEDLEILRSISPQIKTVFVEAIPMPNGTRARSARHQNTLTKLNMFRLTDYDKLVSIDVDMMFTQNSDSIFCIPPFAAVKTFDNPRHRFNSGVVIIRPNLEDFEQLLAHAMRDHKMASFGEQPLLRHRWRKPNCIDPGYNCRAGVCGFLESEPEKLYILHGRFATPNFQWKSHLPRWSAFHRDFLDRFGHTLRKHSDSGSEAASDA